MTNMIEIVVYVSALGGAQNRFRSACSAAQRPNAHSDPTGHGVVRRVIANGVERYRHGSLNRNGKNSVAEKLFHLRMLGFFDAWRSDVRMEKRGNVCRSNG